MNAVFTFSVISMVKTTVKNSSKYFNIYKNKHTNSGTVILQRYCGVLCLSFIARAPVNFCWKNSKILHLWQSFELWSSMRRIFELLQKPMNIRLYIVKWHASYATGPAVLSALLCGYTSPNLWNNHSLFFTTSPISIPHMPVRHHHHLHHLHSVTSSLQVQHLSFFS